MNEYINRPMFQTPQMRLGGGVMAGVAPVRGYHGGDLVESDMVEEQLIEGGDREDRLMNALSSLGTSVYDSGADLFSDAGDLAESGVQGIASLIGIPFEMAGDAYEEYAPEELQSVTDILGEYLPDADDYFEEDFIDFDPSEYKLGTGEEKMNLRDLTDILYDPSSKFDNALLALAGTGIGATPAMVAKIGKSGVKGTKLLNRLISASGAASRKAIPQGRLERLGRMQGANFAINAPLAFGEGAMEGMELEGYSNGGIARLKNGGLLTKLIGYLGEGAGRGLGKLKSIFTGDKKVLDNLEAPPKVIATGRNAKNGSKIGKGKEGKDTEVTTTPESASAVITSGASKPGIFRKIAKYTAGGAGLLWIGDKLVDAITNEEVDVANVNPEDIPPKPEMVEAYGQMMEGSTVPAEDTGLYEENKSWSDKTLGRLKGAAGSAWDKLGDPRVMAGIMAAAKPVEGYTPVNALVAASEGARDYDLQEAQLSKISQGSKSDLQKRFDAIRPYAVADEGESPFDVDRKVWKSLIDQMDGAVKLEALLTLYKSMPDAEVANVDFETWAKGLGVGSVSNLLTKKADTI
tara:strand:- start:7534 stop:9264 length:1731 start_codon:yes stop_codon:yes gene_type:complete